MDHYATLQVHRDADPEVIDKAYRALSMKYHPDRAGGGSQKAATHKMQRINAAYTVLSDPRARRRYDRGLDEESTSAAPAAWDRFMEVGLVGLFMDRVGPNER
ncbi:MAG: J domain-containing protein [Actinomycetota bacterium]|jgi:DnaJ-class molecular chaperone|nr:J domain-containing protein [Actinomycetota bacterium]